MKPRPYRLFAPATDLPEAGGTALDPAAPAAGQSTSEPVNQPPPAKPSLLQLAAAAVASKASLIHEAQLAATTITSLRSDLDYARSELATTQGELSTLQLELAHLRGERSELETALLAAREEAVTAEAGAVAIVATLGVDPATLPAAALPGESRDDLMAAMAAEKDPIKRYQLAERINAL
jgi:hypothetical protein